MTVAVNGATGELGGRVARLLARREQERQLVARDPALESVEGWITTNDVERLTGHGPNDLTDWLGVGAGAQPERRSGEHGRSIP